MEDNSKTRTRNRGFASMPPEQQREIARKGGLSISQNKAHMAKIGAMGGAISKKRAQNKT